MNFDIGVSENCGLRRYMEDRFYFDPDFRNQGELFVGVYDGHGGDEVVKYVVKELHLRFASVLNGGVNFLDGFASSYELISNEVNNLKLGSGSCTANFILSHSKVFFANVGDVRILVVGQSVEQLTIDHHPNLQEEKERIGLCDGVIERNRIASVFGSLAVSRAIGDLEYQPFGLIAVPYVGVHLLRSSDLALVVASDGVFEKMTNEDVAEIVRSDQDAQSTSKLLIETALKNGTRDNVTALVVKLIRT